LFNAFTDPAPDRWGQKLMRHHERQRAEAAGAQPRTLRGVDFLAGVDDQTRLGAMRFKVGDVFVTQTGTPVPPLVELSKLLSAADRLEKNRERKTDLAILLAPAGSLGGARPKATVRDAQGRLHIAKFPWHLDDWPVILWETAALHLAKAAGVEVAPFRLETVGTAKRVLLAERFDRTGSARVPFISACTALDAKDHETRSYMEMVDFLRQSGSSPEADCKQLWRRMAFNVLASNTDDHVRNHGFLRVTGGWTLSPAYDLNPRPVDVYDRVHQMALNELDATSSIEIVRQVAPYFGVKAPEANKIIFDVATAVSKWRTVGASVGLTRSELDRMASAFEHENMDQALKLGSPAPVAPRSASRRQKSPSKKKSTKTATKRVRR